MFYLVLAGGVAGHDIIEGCFAVEHHGAESSCPSAFDYRRGVVEFVDPEGIGESFGRVDCDDHGPPSGMGRGDRGGRSHRCFADAAGTAGDDNPLLTNKVAITIWAITIWAITNWPITIWPITN